MPNRKRSIRIYHTLSILCLSIVLFAGCEDTENAGKREKSPRPVSVFTLTETDPTRFDRLTGSVGSWKTEDLSFEVPGRVQFVIEPETDIKGAWYGTDLGAAADAGKTDATSGQVSLTTATPLARIDDTRYQLNVKSVQAQIRTMQKQKEATQKEATGVIPAKIDAAEAQLTFTKQELSRIEPLHKKGVATQADLDKAMADKRAADANVAQLQASRQAKQAEVLSLDAKLDELKQSLADAMRDVADCQLISPFQGQVAAVQVIPGAFVERGQPVLTVQMMDPIKVELQVSARTSRSLRYKDEVAVYIATYDGTDMATKDGTDMPRDAIVYMIDPTADAATRTFTVTLLMQNEKIKAEVPDELKDPVVRARDIWRVQDREMFQKGKLFVEEHCIHDDEQGSYLWKVVERTKVKTGSGRESTLLEIKKFRVTPGTVQIPFLGLWTFTEFSINEGEEFHIENDLFAGELVLPPGITEPKDGDQLLFDRAQWLLRPGDLVGVDLSGSRMPRSFYVPMDAIFHETGNSYVFSVSADQKAQRIPVNVFDGPNTLKRIEAIDGDSLTEGLKLVARGVHYIQDGEKVNVAGEEKVLP